MDRLTRKIDAYLIQWKPSPTKYPLVVKGARQIGKTEAIKHFAQGNYRSVVEINFALMKQYRSIFDDGFRVDTVIKNISLLNPDFEFFPGETLIFFDEMQDCINCATSLKAFQTDGRYDVICSGSLIPVEVKANDASTPSLNGLIDKDTYGDVKYGIKLANKNIGFNGKFYTIPYFLTFLLKRFLREKGSLQDQ